MRQRIMVVSLVFASLLMTSVAESVRECRSEEHRPQIHFSVPTMWMNDPNGMFYYEGEYHLHYQFHPGSTQWGPMHWGHAVTTDLVHWTDLPVSLYPDDLGLIFSGSAVVDFSNSTGLQQVEEPGNHPIVAIFTHADGKIGQAQSIAWSLNKGRDWTKYEKNPVLPNQGIPDFRDPKVIRYNDEKWVMALAVSQKIQFFGSQDLQSWEYLSEFGEHPSQGAHGGVWECPDLLPLEFEGTTYWILLVSINPGGPNKGSATQYFVGNFDGRTYHSDQIEPLWMDWGEDNYASVSFFNEPKGRHMVMGWLNNWIYANELPTRAEGFNGVMTLPRTLDLTSVNGALHLRSALAEEFSGLRNPDQLHQLEQLRQISPNGVWKVSEEIGFKSPLQEVELAFNIADIQGFSSIAICFVNALEQEVCTGYDHERAVNHEIFLNREKSGKVDIPNFVLRATSGRVDRSNNVITFRIVLDVSAIEVFVDGGLTATTALFFPGAALDTLEIRHHAGSETSRVTLINGKVQGLQSMYQC